MTPGLLTDPYLQRPTDDSVEVAWVTEFPGRRHWLLYGADVANIAVEDLVRLSEDPRGAELAVRVSKAQTVRLSRMREDGDSHPPADAPSIAPETDDAGVLPYIASNRLTLFSILDTADGSVTSYAFDTGSPDSDVRAVDRFILKP
jgi:hypothetical protein